MKNVYLGLVDDHAITRKGIKSLLFENSQYKILLEAESGSQLFIFLEKLDEMPDIIILDLSMPEMDGYQTISQLYNSYPKIKILIYSFYKSEDVILNAINQGACGYVNKSSDPEILVKAIEHIIKYGFYINEQIRKKCSSKRTTKYAKEFHGNQVLTEREIQFIKYASSNMTYKEIAFNLNVSPKTLENYRDSIFQKLNINNRAALTLFAIKNGIIDLY